MSDLKAQLEISADASGVESGVSRAKRSLADLGATAVKAGKEAAAGVEQIGEGGSKLAFTVDKTTKDLARSIERATSAMSAGSKGTSEYFATLANQRGADLGVLKPYLDQLDQATAKTKLAAEANKRLQESTRFLDSLRSQADAVGKTAAQLAAMRAAELGVSDAAAPMIAKLQETEKAASGVGASLASVAKYAIGAAGAYISVSAALGQFSQSINDLAGLDDLSQKTGSSVESLSRLQEVARTFSHDFGQVDSAVSKLARGMTTLDEDGSKARKALAALGVSAADASGKLRDPSEVLVDVSKKLQDYADGAGKTALANDLLGKSGADLLPYLNDLAENYDKLSGASAEAARQAAAFQDQLGILRATSSRLFQSVASDLVPSMNALLTAINDNIRAADELNRSKGVKTWAESAAESTGFLIDKFLYAKNVMAAIKAESYLTLDSMANLAKVALPGLTMNEDTTIGQRFDRFLDGLRNGERRKNADAAWATLAKSNAKAYETQIAESFASVNEDAMFSAIFNAVGKQEKKAVDYKGSSSGDEGARAIKKELEDQAKLLAELNGLTGSFAEDWDRLNKVYARGAISLDQLTESQAKLLAQQPAIKKALDLEARAASAIADEYDEAAKAKADYDKQYLDKQNAAISIVNEYGKAIDANNQLTEYEISLLGQTELSRERSLSQYRIELELQREIAKIEAQKLDSADQAFQISRAREAAARASEGASARVTLDYWKRINEDISRSLTDELVRGGKNAGELIMNYFKTLTLRPVIEAFIAPISGAITSAFLPSAAQAATSGAGALSQVGTAASVANAAANGGSYLGTAASIGGNLLGGASAGLAQLTAGVNPLAALSSVMDVGANSIATAIGQAAGYLGPIVLAASVLAKGLSYKTVGSGVMGSIQADDFSGESYQFKKSTLRGSKTVTSQLDKALDDTFSNAVRGMYDNFATLGDTIGVGGDLLKDFSYEFRLALADFDDAGKQKEIQRALSIMSDSMAQAFVDSFRTSIDTAQQAASRYFTNTIDGQRSFEGGVVEQTRVASPLDPYIDDMVRIFDTFRSSVAGVEGSEGKLSAFVTQLFGLGDALVENGGFLKQFGEALDFDKLEAAAAKGESVVDTFARLNSVFGVTNDLALTLGRDMSSAFGAIGLASTAAREGLIAAAGGLEALASQTAFYAQNFLSSDQQQELARKQLRAALDPVGLGDIDTKDEYTAKVGELFGKTDAESQKLLATLLKLGPAIKTVSDYGVAAAADIAQAAATEMDQRIALFRASGDESTAVALERERELAAMSEGERALQRMIYARQDEASAAERAMQGVNDAFSGLQRAVEAERSSVTAAYQSVMESLGKQIDTVSGSVSKLSSLSSSLRSTVNSMRLDSQAGMDRAAASAQIQSALLLAKTGGVLPDAESLQQALSAVSQPNEQLYASFVDLQRNYLKDKNAIADLADLTDVQLTIEEKALAALQDQKSLAEKAYEAEMQRLDGILTKAQEQLDVLNGIKTGILSIPEALAGFAAAVQAATAARPVPAPAGGGGGSSAPAGSAASFVEGLYGSLLGRGSDADGLAAHLAAIQAGVSFQQITENFLNSQEYLSKIPKLDVGTNYVQRSGLAIIHEGEAVVPKAYNPAANVNALRAANNNSELTAEMRAMRKENEQLRKDLNLLLSRVADSTEKTADLIDEVTEGGNAMRSEVMA